MHTAFIDMNHEPRRKLVERAGPIMLDALRQVMTLTNAHEDSEVGRVCLAAIAAAEGRSA